MYSLHVCAYDHDMCVRVFDVFIHYYSFDLSQEPRGSLFIVCMCV